MDKQTETVYYYQLALSPAGHLHLHPSNQLEDKTLQIDNGILTAFNQGEANGLIALANAAYDQNWSAILHFWQDFAKLYARTLCQFSLEKQATALPLTIPETTDWHTWLQRLPTMLGAEYCTTDIFENLWSRLNHFVGNQTQQATLMDFIAQYLPQWQQIGRISFHLAENKNDPDYPFAFLATYASHVGKNANIHYLPLNRALKEYAGAGNTSALIRLLKPIDDAAKQCEWVKQLLDSQDIYHPLRWHSQQAYQLLKSTPELEAQGIIVRLPNWWKKHPKAKLQINIGSKKQTALNLQSLLDFTVNIVIGDNVLNQDEIAELLNADDNLISLRGQWVEVDKQKLEQAMQHWQQIKADANNGLSFIQGMRLLAGVSTDLSSIDKFDLNSHESNHQVIAGEWLSNILHKLRCPAQAQTMQVKHLSNAKLRGYQQTGVNWLYFLGELGLGACLADDMGLGKTIQIIALLLLRKQAKDHAKRCSLLVLPTSLLANWKAELQRFAPSLRVLFVHPSQTSQQQINALKQRPDKLQNYDVLLTTYGTLWRQQWLSEPHWDRLILDEAQAIKNPSAKQTRIIKTLNANTRIALTGTPIENRLGDLWSLFDFLCPGLLGSANTFKAFIKKLDSQEPVSYAPLRQLVQPYILRRLKTDKRIIGDLPDKTELNSYCGLTASQATLYHKTVKQLNDALNSNNISAIQRKGLVLNYLLKFKQICNHPDQALGHGDYSPQKSGKFIHLKSLCEAINARQEKLLVFTQFREMTQPLALFLQTIFNKTGFILHGATPVKQRQQRVNAFQAENGANFFVLSLKAGGTGLNLTAANHVVHFDRWWNPAVENQATDRAFRIGQKRNVLVHKFISQGTVEEHIDQLIHRKIELSNDILRNDSSPMLTELSDKELISLVSLDINKTKL